MRFFYFERTHTPNLFLPNIYYGRLIKYYTIFLFYFQAQRTILHPGYSSELATSDLAIIIVKNLRFTEFVQPICIWGPAYDKTALYGKKAVVIIIFFITIQVVARPGIARVQNITILL